MTEPNHIDCPGHDAHLEAEIIARLLEMDAAHAMPDAPRNRTIVIGAGNPNVPGLVERLRNEGFEVIEIGDNEAATTENMNRLVEAAKTFTIEIKAMPRLVEPTLKNLTKTSKRQKALKVRRGARHY